jgi:hypothetical protein
VENVPAPLADQGLCGKEPGADVIPVLNDPPVIENDQSVTDRIEDRLQFALLGPQADIGGLELLYFLFHIGVKTDFGTAQSQQLVKIGFIDP